MTTAWQKLLAASQLSSGTAWQLLSSPKTGSGLVINDGVAVELAPFEFAVEVAEMEVEVEVAGALEVVLSPSEVITVEVLEGPIEVEVLA